MLHLKRNITRAIASVATSDIEKQFDATFLAHAKSQINELKILSELRTPHGGTEKGRKTVAPQAHHA